MKQKGYIKKDEQNWYFEFYKSSQTAPTLILLHEGLGSVAQWKDWPLQLMADLNMNILLYDRSGYGKSSLVPSNYPIDYPKHEAKHVLPYIMDHLNISKAHLFGHSDGASIALFAAAYYPDRVLSVISIAAHVIIEKISREGIKKTKEIYQIKLKELLEKYHAEKTDWVFYHWADTWLQPHFRNWNMLEELKKIKSPVLAIQGDQDNYGSLEQLKLIEQYSSASISVLKDCGHQPHKEKPQELKSQIKQFYQEIS